MPLSAKLKDTNEIVYSIDFENSQQIRDKFAHGSLLCVSCGGTFHPRSRKGYMTHFVHDSHVDECDYCNESLEHIALKGSLYKHLKDIYKGFNCQVMIEFPIIIDGAVKRRADVAVISSSGWITTYEIQLSPITVEEIRARTIDANSVGIDVYWFLKQSIITHELETYAFTENPFYIMQESQFYHTHIGKLENLDLSCL